MTSPSDLRALILWLRGAPARCYAFLVYRRLGVTRRGAVREKGPEGARRSSLPSANGYKSVTEVTKPRRGAKTSSVFATGSRRVFRAGSNKRTGVTQAVSRLLRETNTLIWGGAGASANAVTPKPFAPHRGQLQRLQHSQRPEYIGSIASRLRNLSKLRHFICSQACKHY